jgi:hypothetical protein
MQAVFGMPKYHEHSMPNDTIILSSHDLASGSMHANGVLVTCEYVR